MSNSDRDLSKDKTHYTRCAWCHGIRHRTTMVYKGNKAFCGVLHLQEWEAKNAEPDGWDENHWLGKD